MYMIYFNQQIIQYFLTLGGIDVIYSVKLQNSHNRQGPKQISYSCSIGISPAQYSRLAT